MNLRNFIKELDGNRVEGELTKTIFYSILTVFATLFIFYIYSFRFIDNFIPKYGFYLLLSAISYSLITPAVRQVRAYKELPCMSGMMIGMTIGMISGFLSGFYVGATNGMFFGGVFGMAVGISLGIMNGRCCGMMGIMEGIMAGFMGGLMGAMTAVMMLNDHIKAAAIIVLIICMVILLGLNYLIYKETLTLERKRKESQLSTIIVSFILITVTSILMVYGPRSLLFQ